ncbi:MAG TPA: hypothetical protein VMV43_05385 [Candidatus Nanopelagicaceae bacterium]|nr:hypothetical protein [Candidatus Nanopelagicaceae bacterium]
MKKTKIILLILITFSIAFSFTPTVTPQVGTYTFHGAAGNEKILKVNTVNNASLEDLFGPSWVNVIELFGSGAANVGARKKSLVTGVNFSDSWNTGFFGVYDVCTYNTSNWDWTTGAFNATPDSIGDIVTSFYDPTNLTTYINALYSFWWATAYNISMHTAGMYLAQLPTPVSQYLGALVWEPKWGNVGSTVVHNADAGDFALFGIFQYLEDCTEIWSYDATYGAWIGYKIQDNETNTIYEFSIELPTGAEIPGFELPVLLGASMAMTVVLIFVIMKKRK